jgi:HD-GYP domain-containing protein (c-di-GMP phosphodiesterase class II)
MIINIGSLIESLAETIDLVSSEVNNHHRRVACIACYLGEELGLSTNKLENLIIASALHDIGGLTAKDGIDLLDFEENSERHSEFGYMLLKNFRPFAHIAPIVRHHHTYWNSGTDPGYEIPVESRIIFLADRVAVLITKDFSFHQIDGIRKTVIGRKGTFFMPEVVQAFEALSSRESFWLDARDAVSQPIFHENLARNLHLSNEDLLGLGRLYSQIIDFRSSFTATHSSGVAAVAEELAGMCGFSSEERLFIRLAGYLHDIGKLVVPENILEKPSPLTEEEFEIVRSHPYYTNRLLMGIREFDTIRAWASMHHERLDGSGYPFHVKAENFPLGSRIMAVADVFVAVAEDRPYRKGMSRDHAVNLLLEMAKKKQLDANIVDLLARNIRSIDLRRKAEQASARRKYKEFYTDAEPAQSRCMKPDAVQPPM